MLLQGWLAKGGALVWVGIGLIFSGWGVGGQDSLIEDWF